jgi:glutamyl-Q tRNA(Asp) synthetase
MGSLITALASYCDIKQRGGQWYVRIDDIDPLRYDPTALEAILSSLSVHGLHGDGPVRYQSQRLPRYLEARDQLSQMSYYCNCSRSKLKTATVYPGFCRHKLQYADDHAVRLSVDNRPRSFIDAIQGSRRYIPAEQFGDFVIWRRDDLVTYHLATAVDDAEQYSHVLRGSDLYQQTPPQLVLMEALGLNSPDYAHIPVLTYADGTKLSKQTHAPALNNATPQANLKMALAFLGQTPPNEDFTVNQWLSWGVKNWRLDAVPMALKPFDLSQTAD